MLSTVYSIAALPMTPPADPFDGAISDGALESQSWVTTYGVPVMIGAIVFTALLAVGFKWLDRVTRRPAKAAKG